MAANIRRLRLENRYTQELLAERVTDAGKPITLQTLSKTERGDRGIDVDELVAFADALEVPVSVLLADPQEQLDLEAAEAVDAWTHAEANAVRLRREADRQSEQGWDRLVGFAGQSAEHRAATEMALRAWSPKRGHLYAQDLDLTHAELKMAARG